MNLLKKIVRRNLRRKKMSHIILKIKMKKMNFKNYKTKWTKSSVRGKNNPIL
jgi:hypothetical protein